MEEPRGRLSRKYNKRLKPRLILVIPLEVSMRSRCAEHVVCVWSYFLYFALPQSDEF